MSSSGNGVWRQFFIVLEVLHAKHLLITKGSFTVLVLGSGEDFWPLGISLVNKWSSSAESMGFFHWLYTFWLMSNLTSFSFCLCVWTVRSYLAASNIFLNLLYQNESQCSAGYQNTSLPYCKESIAVCFSKPSLVFLLMLGNNTVSETREQRHGSYASWQWAGL